ncbi:hypothetical protein [Caulobacter sp. CCG-8]|uniref:hypothetical protein n=1 Tax=Caulobacter sp. CCG-8 TaxID=3127958 RepID=UPI00307E1212
MTQDPAPPFFVPYIETEKMEEAYAELARAARRAPLPLDERIYSIAYNSRGESWTATVGKQLAGEKVVRKRVRGGSAEHVQRLSDGATVLAIFPGIPFMVWHDGVASVWENPLMAGSPTSIRRFGPPAATP